MDLYSVSSWNHL